MRAELWKMSVLRVDDFVADLRVMSTKTSDELPADFWTNVVRVHRCLNQDLSAARTSFESILICLMSGLLAGCLLWLCFGAASRHCWPLLVTCYAVAAAFAASVCCLQ